MVGTIAPSRQVPAPSDPREAFARLPEIIDCLLEHTLLPPTNLRAVARELRVDDVQRGYRLPFSGAIERSTFGYRVIYAAEQTRERQRFTIAHEFGHAFLFGRNLPYGWSDTEVETFCDQFAAELLMPTRAIAPQLREGLSLRAVEELAERFEVSLQAVAIRVAQATGVTFFIGDASHVRWRTSGPDIDEDILARLAGRALATREPVEEPLWDRSEDCGWVLEAAPRRKHVIMMLRREDTE